MWYIVVWHKHKFMEQVKVIFDCRKKKWPTHVLKEHALKQIKRMGNNEQKDRPHIYVNVIGQLEVFLLYMWF